MKRFQSFICGFLAAVIIFTCIPAFAETVEAAFNSLTIIVNDKNVAEKGQNYTLPDGTQIPFTIVYEGTTYLPLRKMTEIFNKDLAYDSSAGAIKISDKSLSIRGDETLMGVTKAQLARWLVQSFDIIENATTDTIADVPTSNEYYNDIALAIGNKLMFYGSGSGTYIKKFDPDKKVTRMQFASCLFTALKFDESVYYKPTFVIPDIDTSMLSWQNIVYQMVDLGFINVYDDGTFRPHKPLEMDLTPNKALQSYVVNK